MSVKAKGKRGMLKAPFPAIGGKGAIRDLVWERLGQVDNYVEPFAYSLAVLFGNPHGPARKETINDLNCYVANFWRSVQADPVGVAEHADWPVNEADMHARHRWLVESDEARELRTRILTDPKYYNSQIAGWWAWGQCLWIGPGWCSPISRKKEGGISERRPGLSERGGLRSKVHEQRPRNDNVGVLTGPGHWSQRPDLKAGSFVHPNWSPREGSRPQLGDARSRGRGVHANDHANTCEERRDWVIRWMWMLADRLRNVRVCCGDWSRVCKSKTTTVRLGQTGIFLDPPYRIHLQDGSISRDHRLYATDDVADVNKMNDKVLEYCKTHGSNPKIRIVLCSLEGEGNEVLVEEHGWTVHAWTGSGYGKSKKGRENSARERVYFSPHCIIPERDLHPLFAGVPDYV